MIVRNIAFAVVTAASIVPALTNASPARVSAKACASAFASSIAAPGGSPPAYRLAYRDIAGTALEDSFPADFTFTLEAHAPKTGLTIARAVCSTNYRGVVTAISAVPLDAAPAGPAQY
jgi:hypothetical protein